MNRDVFFATIRPHLGPFKQSQVEGFTKILDEAVRRGLSIFLTAYLLATTWWETADEMQPIRERGGEKYLKSKKYYPWVGEGLVQVTWEVNHRKFGATAPSQLMTWEKALPALFDGCLQGMFTGKKLTDYITPGRVDYENARRVVNGTDKAKEIAALALLFEKALREAKWGAPPASPTDTADFKEDLHEERLKPVPVPEAPKGFWARFWKMLGW